jgi:hypothetical protein
VNSFRQLIQLEINRRGQPQAQRLANLRTDQTPRRGQRRSRGIARFGAAQNGVKDRGVMQVSSHPDICDGDESKPGVLEAAG